MVRHKVMTLSEFYKADIFDLDFLLTHLDEVERDAMERMRMIMWAALAPYSKKQLAPEGILKFDWENRTDTGERVVTTKEDFDKLLKMYQK